MRALILAVLVAGVLAAGAAWVLSAPSGVDAETAKAVAAPGNAEAGKIVFYMGGCESCHMTPGQPDPLKLGGGLELKSPFGSFYPPNISSDAKDGIGGWTPVDFANSLLAGMSRQGENLYPAFPYTSYHNMKPEDARDLFAFLHTLPAVQGRAPPHGLSFPFNIRRAVGLWKLLFFNRAPLTTPADASESWKLGQYIVEGPGHCAECHSPRNFLGAIVASKRLTGGPNPEGKGKVPDITSAGLKDWSNDDIVGALQTGFTPSGDSLGSSMGAVVRNMAQLPKGHLQAIAEYLKSYKAP